MKITALAKRSGPNMATKIARTASRKSLLSGSWFDGWQSGWWGRSIRQWGGDGSLWGQGSHPGSKVDFASHVGSGLASSVLMSPVRWVQRTLPEAPIRLRLKDDEEAIPDHPMVDMLNRPNKFHTCNAMLQAAIYSFIVDGNGYWIKKRSTDNSPRWWEDVTGELQELWWVPHWRILPCSPPGGTEYISHYELFMRHHGRIRLPIENVIHFRNGIDPERPQYGMSVIYSELREIYTDDEAAAFTSTILRNVGVPGLVVSPKMWPSGDGDDMMIIQDTEAVKRYVEERFGGDNRGRSLVLEAPADVKTLGFNPRELELGNIRNIVEERVCAAIGIQPSVVGFGTGLQQTKVGAPQPLSASLYTRTGEIAMGDVKVGDEIAVPGGFGKVSAVYPQGAQDIYRVTFQDGSIAESTLDHLWEVTQPITREPALHGVLELGEIAKFADARLRRTKVPLQGEVGFDKRDLPVDPYLLGALIGDGSFRATLRFTNHESELVDRVRERLPSGYSLVRIVDEGHDYRIRWDGKRAQNPMIQALRELGLWMKYSHEKFIPDDYKYSSVEDRKALLRGILDTDGWVNHHGQPAICQTSKRLADDIGWLVRSLGGYALTRTKAANREERMIAGRTMRSRHDMWSQSIVVPNASDFFSMERKLAKCAKRTKAPARTFRSIEFARREEAQCITVEGSLYLTDNFIVTHNTADSNVRLSWMNGVIPMQGVFAEALAMSLLPEYEEDPNQFRVYFDRSKIQALQEDADNKVKRLDIAVKGGWMRVDHAQEQAGLDVDETQDVYLRPMNLMPVRANEREEAPPRPQQQQSPAPPAR